MTLRKVVTMAGSDSSGGAGIQADLKTFEELDVYGMCALTVIVSMDAKNNWAHGIFPVEIAATEAGMDTAASTGLDAMKTGMLPTVDMIKLAARKIDEYQIPNVVIDPVMVCKGTDEVLVPENTVAMREFLLPRATVTTPNLFEAWQLAELDGPIRTFEQMKDAARKIHGFGAKNVYIKGGSKLVGQNAAVDLFFDGEEFTLLETEKIDTTYTHGAGCTTAAAITAGLAHGLSPREAAIQAKSFVGAGIRHGWKLNEFVGPVMHSAYRLHGPEKVTIR
ncbi:MAG: pdxK [Bacillales bacterium]|jgi:pyridoxine kinase|nr:pdxK [Bacillales bacterium]